MNPVEIHRGNAPIVLGLPHSGTYLPNEIYSRLNERGRALGDTDWHVHTLYDGLLDGLTTVRATFHRYVIDANRDPSGSSLYPGQNTTTLVPLTDFDGENIWTHPPNEAEIEHLKAAFHTPYHVALAAELDRVRARHGVALLYDCHSIRSRIPFLFAGTLPDFNIGTNLGTTCAPAIEEATCEICAAATGYSSVVNGRFKGGFCVRHYGKPGIGRHAIQMELAQSTYLRAEEAPWLYDENRAARLRAQLTSILEKLVELTVQLRSKR